MLDAPKKEEGKTHAAAAHRSRDAPRSNGEHSLSRSDKLPSPGARCSEAELAGIFERLNCRAQSWQNRLEKLNGDRLLGGFFASTRAKLREIVERLGVRHLVNLAGCPAP
jgi:hypothetical protein